jgi:hypothetical protein
MSKFKDNNLVLIETEMIKFPSSNLYDSTASLIVTGSNNISGDKIKEVEIDDSAKADGRVLQYDQGSNTIKYVD